MMCEETPVHFDFPVFDEPFTISPSEIQELLSSIFQQDNEPLSPSSTTSSSLGTNRAVYSAEERRVRRKISNRESAKRSRLRKKMHLEKLHDQANRLKTENRDLKNQLLALTRHCQMVRAESDRLQLESILLQQRLAGLTRLLHFPVQLQ